MTRILDIADKRSVDRRSSSMNTFTKFHFRHYGNLNRNSQKFGFVRPSTPFLSSFLVPTISKIGIRQTVHVLLYVSLMSPSRPVPSRRVIGAVATLSTPAIKCRAIKQQTINDSRGRLQQFSRRGVRLPLFGVASFESVSFFLSSNLHVLIH